MRKSIINLSLIASALFADSIVEISPISVTATGIEEKVIEQPLSIVTKSEEEIKLDQVIFQKDLLNSLSGVHIEQTGSVIGHTTAIRMPENKSAYYLFMQDGIPVQSSGFFNHNGLAYTTFQSATSVEVIKGAGTALYGSDAVAAVINVESLKAPSKTKVVSIKGMAGSNGYGSGTLEMSDTIDKDSGYRANISYMHSDGWRENTKADRAEANIRYDQTVNDTNDLKFIVNFSKTEAEQADSFTDYAKIKDGSTDASDNTGYYTALEKTDIKRKFDYARLSLEWDNYSVDGLEISTTPYIRYNRNRYVQTWFPESYPSNDNELMTMGLLQKNTYEASWGKLVAGFDAEHTQSTLKYNQNFDMLGVSGKNYYAGPIFDYNVAYTAVAPYLHTEYKILNELVMTAGLRYDYNHYDYTNNLADGVVSTATYYYRPGDRTDTFSHLSPKLSLSYKPREDTNIYLRYANGFRIPQASRLYSQTAKVTQTDNLNPETSNTYEIGIKKEFVSKSYFELIAYYMTIEDTITKYTGATTDYYANGGSTIHQGIETTFKYQATKEWGAYLAYSYSTHNYDNNPTYKDNEISQAPNNLGNARLTYAPSYLHGFRVMGECQYVGSYWMEDTHDAGKYDGYTIGNIKADYSVNKALNFFAKVTNITDERYAISASAKVRSSSTSYDYSPGDPRQVYAGLEYRW